MAMRAYRFFRTSLRNKPPIEDDDEVHRQHKLRQKCRQFGKKFLMFMFSHIGLTGLVVGYSILGGVIFMKLESSNELREKVAVGNMRSHFVQTLWNATLDLNILHKQNWTILADKIFKDFQTDVYTAVKEKGWDGTEGGGTTTRHPQWTYAGALLYSVTIITTIGYGHIAPRTPWGRVATIVYALIGIPITLLCLANIGGALGNCFRFIYGKILCCGLCKNRRNSQNIRIITNTAETKGQGCCGRSRQKEQGFDNGLNQAKTKGQGCCGRSRQNEQGFDNGLNQAKTKGQGCCGRSKQNEQGFDHGVNKAKTKDQGCCGRSKQKEQGSDHEVNKTKTKRQGCCGRSKQKEQGSDHEVNKAKTKGQGCCGRSKQKEQGFDHGVNKTKTKGQGCCGNSKKKNQKIDNSVVEPTEFAVILEPSRDCEVDNGHYIAETQNLSMENPPKFQRLDNRVNRSKTRGCGCCGRSKQEEHGYDNGVDEPLEVTVTFETASDYDEHDIIRVPVIVTLGIMAGYIFGGAMLFTLWEDDWDYLVGAYFCFITLSTIGFGDFVPGTSISSWDSQEKRLLCSLYLLFGLALLAMCFDLMQEQVRYTCKRIGCWLGIVENRRT